MGKEAVRIGWGRWACGLAVLFVLSSAGCKRHVVLRVSAVSLGRAQAVEWQCEAGRPACATDGIVDEAAWNQSLTEFLPLPECTSGVSEVFLEGTGPSTRAVVVCQGEGALTAGDVGRSALWMRSPTPPGPKPRLCVPGGTACTAAASPPVPVTRTFPLPDCGDGGIGRILVIEPYHHPRLRVVCLDPEAAGVDEDCPGGARPEPDLEHGGFVCPGLAATAGENGEGPR